MLCAAGARRALQSWELPVLGPLRLRCPPRVVQRPFYRYQTTIAEKSRLPRIVQPSLWKNLVPKSLRTSYGSKKTSKFTDNPANYFIWIYIFIGSQAIRILRIKHEAAEHRRMADIKLELLREVLDKLERGEDVDVERVLGTGDETAEREWEQALREIESEERLWQNNRSRRKAEKHRKQMEEVEEVENSPVEEDLMLSHEPTASNSLPARPSFY
jgi:hypothetical protein